MGKTTTIDLRSWLILAIMILIVLLLPSCNDHKSLETGNNASAESIKETNSQNKIVEVVTFTLKEGVTKEAFSLVNQAVEVEYVSKQPGFISRESAEGDAGEWLVLVHWQSIKDAEASMSSFSDAAGTKDFISSINVNSMIMKRYKTSQ